MKLNNEELSSVYGGLSLSASLFDGLAKFFGSIFEIGQEIGSAIRRAKTKNYC